MKRLTASRPLFALLLLLLSVFACKLGASSPTSTFKAFQEAQRKKDVAGIKKTLSKGSLAMLGKAAKAQNKSLDESLKEGFDDPAFKAQNTPETRNEKVDGDTATLEVQDQDSKKWETMYFVKEENDWKIALDKTLEEMFKKMTP